MSRLVLGINSAHADSSAALVGEYPRLYARMAELLRMRASEMDMAPMTLVADAFLLGRRITVEAFIE